MGTKLKKLLEQNRKAISRRWLDAVVNSYPADTAKFLKSQKDPFSNPVGQTTVKGLEALLDAVLAEAMDRDAAVAALDPVIRIRAVQDFTPSKAVAFILSLKSIIRETVGKELKDAADRAGLADLDRRVDELCLIGFDIYMRCREQVFQLKVDTERKKIYSAFSRAGLIEEAPADGPGLKAS